MRRSIRGNRHRKSVWHVVVVVVVGLEYVRGHARVGSVSSVKINVLLGSRGRINGQRCGGADWGAKDSSRTTIRTRPMTNRRRGRPCPDDETVDGWFRRHPDARGRFFIIIKHSRCYWRALHEFSILRTVSESLPDLLSSRFTNAARFLNI